MQREQVHSPVNSRYFVCKWVWVNMLYATLLHTVHVGTSNDTLGGPMQLARDLPAPNIDF